MKSKIIIFSALLFHASFVLAQENEVEVLKYPEFASLINSKEKNIRVFNFWATWCKPCIKELPYFERLNQEYSNQGVKVTLVSFDFVENLDNRVKKFLTKKNIKSEVVLLDETDYNKFIDKIHPEWSGAIPATLIVDNRNGKLEKRFFEKEFHEGEVKELIQEYF